ncbi:hypothetical protein BN1723_011162 [Verticillium longisporum]|uniref:Uncharacterized protein n=1 Tax=Verticillium longisporum TaxID=100787 RepID=A0A0G4L4J2_VERLO|nr:hypothetical protein BN1723_011162 [Verticillium longisporum]
MILCILRISVEHELHIAQHQRLRRPKMRAVIELQRLIESLGGHSVDKVHVAHLRRIPHAKNRRGRVEIPRPCREIRGHGSRIGIVHGRPLEIGVRVGEQDCGVTTKDFVVEVRVPELPQLAVSRGQGVQRRRAPHDVCVAGKGLRKAGDDQIAVGKNVNVGKGSDCLVDHEEEAELVRQGLDAA